MTGDRVEQVFRCVHDGRAFAKVMIRDGQRVVWTAAAHNGHRALIRSELEEQLREREDELAGLPRPLAPVLPVTAAAASGDEATLLAALIARLKAALADGERDWTESIEPLPSELDVGLTELGYETLPRRANCPRCHRLYQIRVGVSEGGAWSAVLKSVV